MREQLIQNDILHWLNLQQGVFAWRSQSQGTWDAKIGSYRRTGGFQIRGISDISAIIAPNGVFLAIEVKSEKGKVSVEQKAFINKIGSMGGIAIVARSLNDVIDLFKLIRSK